MRLLAVVLCFSALACSMSGQTASGTITGIVTDPAGAAVASASVEVKNTDTGVIYPTVTTTTGSYSANNLPLGSYSVSVTIPGFKEIHTHWNQCRGHAGLEYSNCPGSRRD